jgi:hypothetical protein
MSEARRRYFSHDEKTRRLFSQRFDRKPFLFNHQLDSHYLLSLPCLKELGDKMAMEKTPQGFLRLSNSSHDGQWGSSAFRTALRRGFDEIETSKMRLKLSRIHREHLYGELFGVCRDELSELTSIDLASSYREGLATMFISSPGEVTPCHCDLEANCLLQILGTKTVYILDGDDRRVLGWSELEDYWHTGSWGEFRDEFRWMAWVFTLRPGLGLHNPTNYPHWVENGPAPSVSLSLGFTRARNPVDVLRVNYYLRKLGVEPTPPGEMGSLDAAKAALVRGARNLRCAVRLRL